jgi:hypothetical protein
MQVKWVYSKMSFQHSYGMRRSVEKNKPILYCIP